MSEDAGTVLECFINDVANLPAEVNHLFEEMHAKEKQLIECQKSIAQRDSALQKVIRANNGTHIHNPKEDQYVAVIRKHYATADRLQEEKVALAQKALDLIDRHFRRLNSKIRTLQNDGLFPQDPTPPPTARPTPSRVHSRASPSSARHPSIPSYLQSSIRASSPYTGSHDRKRPRLSEATITSTHATSEAASRPGTPSTSHQKRGVRNSNIRERDRKRKRKEREETDEDVEEEDEEDGTDDKRLYCTCNEVSYGNMVGCDNPDCAYEWFHWSCVGITKEPAGAWYCEECKIKLGK